MVVIRLARVGRNKYPVYRIVAADKRRSATSKFLAILGQYNPHTKKIVLKQEEIQKYLDNGAQASDRVLRLFQKEGVKLPGWAKTHDRNKAPKKAAEEGAESGDDKAVEGVATAEASAEAAEPNAEAAKEDVGTAKEDDNKAAAAEATEAVAEAAEKTSKEESAKPDKEAKPEDKSEEKSEDSSEAKPEDKPAK